MSRIFGYLTNPIISNEEFRTKVEKIKEKGLEARTFSRGKRNNAPIGPRGVIFSGEDSYIDPYRLLDFFYNYRLPFSPINGLTYDVSTSQNSSKLTKPDLEDAKWGDSYFAVRIKKIKEEKLISFNEFFLRDNPEIDFRLNHTNAIYEGITTPENLHQQMDKTKKMLEKEGFEVDRKDSTIIYHLLR